MKKNIDSGGSGLPPLNLPPARLRFQKKEDDLFVWDILRKKFVVFTPEEYVRQSFINWLINQKGYPVSLMANEVSIHLNENLLRCDTVIFSSDQTAPQIIIEYKAPYIEISQDVFNQIVAYNMVLQVKYLIVTNGITHYCCEIDYINFTYNFLKEIPSYHSL